jgi:hypothetical protein
MFREVAFSPCCVVLMGVIVLADENRRISGFEISIFG